MVALLGIESTPQTQNPREGDKDVWEALGGVQHGGGGGRVAPPSKLQRACFVLGSVAGQKAGWYIFFFTGLPDPDCTSEKPSFFPGNQSVTTLGGHH